MAEGQQGQGGATVRQPRADQIGQDRHRQMRAGGVADDQNLVALRQCCADAEAKF
jgi:hypothetical protein